MSIFEEYVALFHRALTERPIALAARRGDRALAVQFHVGPATASHAERPLQDGLRRALDRYAAMLDEIDVFCTGTQLGDSQIYAVRLAWWPGSGRRAGPRSLART